MAQKCLGNPGRFTPSPYEPKEDLFNLVRFNRRDWSATRDLLVAHGRRLGAVDSSVVGRWAAVALLYATGAAEDSMDAHKLVLELQKDRDEPTSWRLVETYCATDPCDPDTARPDNVDRTGQLYEQLDVNKLKRSMGQGQEDHFFETARAGLSRFLPAVVVRKHRELLATMPTRRGIALRQGTWSTLDHAVLLDQNSAARFLALAIQLSSDPIDVDASSVEHVQQVLLHAAFPRLSPAEQFSGLAAVPDPNHIWLELLRIAKQGSPSQLMNAIHQIGPSDIQVLVPLALASRVADQALPGFSEMLPGLLTSPHPAVRSAALNVAGLSGDHETLQAVVTSGWSAEPLARNSRECIAGSIALIQAAKTGIARGSEILSRIAPETFGIACRQLDCDAVVALAPMLDACVHMAAEFDAPLPPVQIFLTLNRDTAIAEAIHSFTEPAPPESSIIDAFARLSEWQEEFEARQVRLNDAYDKFSASMYPQAAALVLWAFRLDDLRRVLDVAPGLTDGWIKLLRSKGAPQRRALRNFGLLLASALTHITSRLGEAVDLLSSLQDGESYVLIRYTAAHVPLASAALWWAADELAVNNLRFARLDRCSNDNDLALEVAAALYAEKAAILKIYIQDRLKSSIPAEVARAIAVIGFSDDERLASEVFATYDTAEGLLGAAASACRFAMDRHRWSKYWFESMKVATSEVAFWTASTLFLKVIDARFDVLHHKDPVGSDIFNSWWWSVERRLEQRYEKWSDKRKKTLFGTEAPKAIYLLPTGTQPASH